MYKIALLIILINCVDMSYAQSPDSIRISLKIDTIRTYAECVININISRKDKSEFKFPKSFSVGNMYSEEPLMIDIQKLSESNKFRRFDCNEFTQGVPVVLMNQPYSIQKEIDITDSLGNLDCIKRGYYRLSILYHDQVAISFDGDSYSVRSNWIYFYVESDKIYLGRIRKIRE